tara:strand:+ start:426 stop:683 length:258 start_codon:yes stop_codon:yes gene_type:complete
LANAPACFLPDLPDHSNRYFQGKGLEIRYNVCMAAAIAADTASGVPFWALADQHMLEAQLALPVNQQKSQRIEALNKAIKNASDV